MNQYDDIGDASSFLRGSTSSIHLYFSIIFCSTYNENMLYNFCYIHSLLYYYKLYLWLVYWISPWQFIAYFKLINIRSGSVQVLIKDFNYAKRMQRESFSTNKFCHNCAIKSIFAALERQNCCLLTEPFMTNVLCRISSYPFKRLFEILLHISLYYFC